ncbi:MAG: helix-turn-helix transcriptional regulator, partial [Gammaproteobacteria bacterium]|nr:helix-turn-helix transcriptional regulator [Gammaproteobacteria bacterium]MDH5731375.1 helix-turn-helix transcriptional regulator [Gammaproteobacteria bacterium]
MPSVIKTDASTIITCAQSTFFLTRLNAVTQTRLMEVIHALISLKAENELAEIIDNQIAYLIPHDFSVIGIGDANTFKSDLLLNVSYPQDYLDTIISQRGDALVIDSPIVKAWVKQPVTMIIENLPLLYQKNNCWKEAIVRHRIRDSIVSGVLGVDGVKTSFVSFVSQNHGFTQNHLYILELLTPYLHVAMLRILKKKIACEQKYVKLSSREKEILQWLYHGLTNEEVAKQLHISSNTVKNHIHNILNKLGVNNRSQALVKAMNSGVIQRN